VHFSTSRILLFPDTDSSWCPITPLDSQRKTDDLAVPFRDIKKVHTLYHNDRRFQKGPMYGCTRVLIVFDGKVVDPNELHSPFHQILGSVLS
jgi:hypothetical protein